MRNLTSGKILRILAEAANDDDKEDGDVSYHAVPVILAKISTRVFFFS